MDVLIALFFILVLGQYCAHQNYERPGQLFTSNTSQCWWKRGRVKIAAAGVFFIIHLDVLGVFVGNR